MLHSLLGLLQLLLCVLLEYAVMLLLLQLSFPLMGLSIMCLQAICWGMGPVLLQLCMLDCLLGWRWRSLALHRW
jgi:hypothetical protein